MLLDANEEIFELIEMLNQEKVLFTNSRIKRDSVPDNLYVYDVRHDDKNQGDMCEIKPYIKVNYWGTIICKSPINMTDGDCCFINKDDYNYQDEYMTLKEFIIV